MSIQLLIFYIFAATAVGSAAMVITSRNPVHSALFLVLTFVASAGIWILAQAEFLALILILVYVGAVMTLFLFVVMMLNINIAVARKQMLRFLPIGIGVVALLLFLMFVAIKPENFGFDHLAQATAMPADFSSVEAIGKILYTDYVLPFELAAVLLLVAIIAAISLTHRPPRKRKTQNPVEQIRVRRQDRVKLVDMPVEEGNK